MRMGLKRRAIKKAGGGWGGGGGRKFTSSYKVQTPDPPWDYF